MRYYLAYCLLTAFLVLTSSQGNASALKGQTITFCGDGSGWPPYTYVLPANPKEVLGFDVDVVRSILADHDIEAKFIMPSWKQCLKLAKEGKVVQVALSSSYSEERERDYLYTHKYYSTVMSYFYSRARFEETQPQIAVASDLFLYGPVCGRYFFNYEGTGVFKNDQIQQSGKSFEALINRTLNGGCTFFLSRPSILFGFSLIGKNIMDNDQFDYAPVPGAMKDDFHMLISKQFKHKKELKTILDEGILRMQNSGELRAILNKYYAKMQILSDN